MTEESPTAYWRMGGITVPEVEDYLYSMLPPRDEVLAEMEADAAKNDYAIVGPAVARVLYQLAVISGARRIFEMGSAIGYSTIWWARAVGDGGKVVYTDGDPKRAEKARRYFDRASAFPRAWATRWRCFPKRKSRTTSSSWMWTKWIIREPLDWPSRASRAAAYLSPTMFFGAGNSPSPIPTRRPAPSWSSIVSSTSRRNCSLPSCPFEMGSQCPSRSSGGHRYLVSPSRPGGSCRC